MEKTTYKPRKRVKFTDKYYRDYPLEKIKKIRRNEPCPCGSGLKFKKCCAE